MSDVNDWNARIIAEFRANEGRVGGQFEGAPLLLLHTTGARSGAERVNPMMYFEIDGYLYVFASKAGIGSPPPGGCGPPQGARPYAMSASRGPATH